jgi:predicted nucleic acid-binding protein
MATYWDTCCLLKLYCRESDSDTCVREISSARLPPRTSVLVRIELSYAFQQKEARNETGGRSADQLFDDFHADVERGRIQLLPFGDDVSVEARNIARKCCMGSPPVLLRSLDGIHLATAMLSGCRRVLSTDNRMNTAAAMLLQTADDAG